MNPLRIHLQLIGMVILWGASWPWGASGCSSYADICCFKRALFFAIIPLIIWLYAANRFKYAKQLRPNQWVGLLLTAFAWDLWLFDFLYLGFEICSSRARNDGRCL